MPREAVQTIAAGTTEIVRLTQLSPEHHDYRNCANTGSLSGESTRNLSELMEFAISYLTTYLGRVPDSSRNPHFLVSEVSMGELMRMPVVSSLYEVQAGSSRPRTDHQHH